MPGDFAARPVEIAQGMGNANETTNVCPCSRAVDWNERVWVFRKRVGARCRDESGLRGFAKSD